MQDPFKWEDDISAQMSTAHPVIDINGTGTGQTVAAEGEGGSVCEWSKSSSEELIKFAESMTLI